jgi:hypothetical protein
MDYYPCYVVQHGHENGTPYWYEQTGACAASALAAGPDPPAASPEACLCCCSASAFFAASFHAGSPQASSSSIALSVPTTLSAPPAPPTAATSDAPCCCWAVFQAGTPHASSSVAAAIGIAGADDDALDCDTAALLWVCHAGAGHSPSSCVFRYSPHPASLSGSTGGETASFESAKSGGSLDSRRRFEWKSIALIDSGSPEAPTLATCDVRPSCSRLLFSLPCAIRTRGEVALRPQRKHTWIGRNCLNFKSLPGSPRYSILRNASNALRQ